MELLFSLVDPLLYSEMQCLALSSQRGCFCQSKTDELFFHRQSQNYVSLYDQNAVLNVFFFLYFVIKLNIIMLSHHKFKHSVFHYIKKLKVCLQSYFFPQIESGVYNLRISAFFANDQQQVQGSTRWCGMEPYAFAKSSDNTALSPHLLRGPWRYTSNRSIKVLSESSSQRTHTGL